MAWFKSSLKCFVPSSPIFAGYLVYYSNKDVHPVNKSVSCLGGSTCMNIHPATVLCLDDDICVCLRFFSL